MGAAGAFTTEFWPEQNFRETETFGATAMMFPSWENVGLFLGQIFHGRFELCVVIQNQRSTVFVFF